MNLTPRQRRLLNCLIKREHSRRELRDKVGAENVPEVKSQLIKKGFAIKCERRPKIDRDNKSTRPGWYSFRTKDELLRVKQLLASAPTLASDINNHKAKQSTDGAILPQ